jgi:2TM domain
MWFAIDLVDDSTGWWFYWPMLGTGLAVVITGIGLFGLGGLFGADWERRQIDKYLERRGDRRSGRTLCPDTGRGETAGGFQAHDGDAVSDAQASMRQPWQLNGRKDVGEMADHVAPGGVATWDDEQGAGEPLVLLAPGQATDRGRAIELLKEFLAGPHAIGLVLVSEGMHGLRAGQAGRRSPAAPVMVVPEVSRNRFRREGEYWTVCYEGTVRVRDAKGLRHLARLLADPGREFHTVDLEAAERQPAPAAPRGSRARGGEAELAVRADLGDAGVLLDAQAKAAYKTRIEQLRADLEEAQRCNDPTRAAKARHEMDFLVAELARAVGLGGRDRRAAAHAERARLNVTRAIRAAIANLARANPALGRHLAATVRTGRYCAYTPDPRVPITWER